MKWMLSGILWCKNVKRIPDEQIMEELLQENDQTVHLYFLLAMAHHAGSNPEAALEYIGEGQELMQRLNVADDDLAASSFRKLKVGSAGESLVQPLMQCLIAALQELSLGWMHRGVPLVSIDTICRCRMISHNVRQIKEGHKLVES